MPLAQSIVLADGRRLAFDDVGDSRGFPVFFFHGVPGSRRYWTLAGPGELFSSNGVRLIAADRPGVGLSTPHDSRSVLSFAEDTRELADALGIESFGVIGFSGGAPYALATAAVHPERTAVVALVAPMGDLSVRRLFDGLDPYVRRALQLAAKSHGLLRNRLADRLDAAHLVALGAERAWAHLPASDRRVLSRPEVRTAARETMEEAARRGLEGLRLDAEILLRPWEFDLSQVRVPVDIFSGSADPWSTDETTHWMKVSLRDVRLHRSRGAGHFAVLADEFDAVMESLLSHVPTPRRVLETHLVTSA